MFEFKALSNVQLQQKQASQHGVQHEENLLAETSAKESQLQSQISSLEQEYKNCAQVNMYIPIIPK